jgi:dTDP-4-amino-4,6-dideoxygalactose transaminase
MTPDQDIPGGNAARTAASAQSSSNEPRAVSPLSPTAAPERLKVPFLRPNPPRLSHLVDGLASIENSGIFSNYGPVNCQLEDGLLTRVFKSGGECLTVCNATLGLMLAIKQAVGWQPRGRYALMPSFTFAATAHAALWCGLTPLLCDIDPHTWLPDADAEQAMIDRHGAEIAVILPNATFGNCLDLARYERISTAHGIPVVIDAAASLGSIGADGRAFGAGCPHPLVFSMHATKSFATAEAGVIYCADAARIATLRMMGNFGFGEPRTATMPGLNSKLGEVSALLGLAKLGEFERITTHRQGIYALYRELLPDLDFQRLTGARTAHQFVPVLVPPSLAGKVQDVIAALAEQGIGAGRYFVPHIAEQSYFQASCIAGELPVTIATSRRIISLPLSDSITPADIDLVCDALRRACRSTAGADGRAARPVALSA